MKWLMFLSFLLVACSDDVVMNRSDMNDEYEFHYIRDKEKNLCFAVFDTSQKFGMTVVPCENAFPSPPPAAQTLIVPPVVAPPVVVMPDAGD